MAQYLVSPDGHAIAIRSIYDEDGITAYGIMTDKQGGHWGKKVDVEGWQELAPVVAPVEE